MTKLRDQMMGELQLRNYSEHTIYSYIGAVERFARHFWKSPTELGADNVKQFLLFLKNEKKVVWQTVQANRAALRFLYVSVLKQKWFEEEIPPPIRRPTLPTVLSAEEITRMLDLTTNLKHWTIIALFYGTGLRASELKMLKVEDIEGERMCTGSRPPRSSNPSLGQAGKGRITAVRFNPQYSIPNSTLAAPSKSYHRQYGGVQDFVFVQHHVAAVLPMIPKDITIRTVEVFSNPVPEVLFHPPI